MCIHPSRGNHDLLLDSAFVNHFPERIIERPGSQLWKSVIYLQCESYTAKFPNGRQLNIYGSPWTPQFGNWAFQYPPIRDIFHGVVPPDTDILLTHGPPKLHLDVEPGQVSSFKGCEHLLREIWRVRSSLKLIVFGHIHAGHGKEVVQFDLLQRSYEAIALGRAGLPSLIMMAVLLLWSFIRRLFSLRDNGQQDSDTIQLANAAIAPIPDDPDARQPLVFQV